MKSFIKNLLIILLVTMTNYVGAQVAPEPYSNWFFGDKAGLSFNKNSVDVYSSTEPTLTGKLHSLEGCSSISDDFGNLLFYTNGLRVWNHKHEQMVNGFGLRGDTSATQSVMIIPQPKNPGIYYIFTLEQGVTGNDLFYSIVDMNRHNGLGEVITRNILLANNMSERVTTTLKNNGDDYWVLTHEANSSRFFVFGFDSTGVNKTPVISDIGSKHEGTCGSIGYMKTRCNKLAVAITNCAGATNKDRVDVFEFSNTTGRVTRFIHSYKIPNAYGVEFSTTARYLYVSGWHGGNLYRIDLKLFPFDPAAKVVIGLSNAYGNLSEINSFGALMMGPDRLIYVAKNKSGFLDVITENGNYIRNAVSLFGAKSRFGLPNIPQFICECELGPSFIHAKRSPFCVNKTITFSALDAPYPYGNLIRDSLRWHFGDPYTDSLGNTSLSNSTSHYYPYPGTYKVKLYRKCFSEDLLVATYTVYISDCASILNGDECVNDVVNFFMNQAYRIQSILWNFGDPGSGANNTSTQVWATHKYSQPGSYLVTAKVVYKGGYTRTYTKYITVYPPPRLNLGPDINTCNGDKIPKYFSACGFDVLRTSFLWHNGSRNCYYKVKPEDKFVSLKVQQGSCIAIDTVWILRDSLSIGPDRKICPGDSVVLGPDTPWESYNWTVLGDTNTISNDSIRTYAP